MTGGLEALLSEALFPTMYVAVSVITPNTSISRSLTTAVFSIECRK